MTKFRSGVGSERYGLRALNRVFDVTVARTDRDEADAVRVRAYDREDAVYGVNAAYPGRVKRVISVRPVRREG